MPPTASHRRTSDHDEPPFTGSASSPTGLAEEYGDLPGAPSADDTEAWAPGGGPVGAVPDATPFTPTLLPDMSKMPSMARTEFRQAVNAGTREAFEAWTSKWATPGQPDGMAQPVPEVEPAPAAEPDQSHEEAAFNQALAKVGIEAEHFDVYLEAPAAKVEQRLAKLPPEDFEQACLDGEARIVREQFRGSRGAYDAAMDELTAAAKAVGLDADAINKSGVLSDPSVFMRALSLARQARTGEARHSPVVDLSVDPRAKGAS